MSQAQSAPSAATATTPTTASTPPDGYRFAAQLAEVEQSGCKVLAIDGRTVALFAADGQVHAIDNRCPHMGFPLDRGTVQDGILTCHWHHARFDLSTGGAFDGFADDVDRFPACVVDGAVWVDVSRHGDRRAHMRSRLREGLEQDIPLVLAKAAIHLLEAGDDPVDPFACALEFGVRNRSAGWGQGLTMLTCFQDLLPALDPADRPWALYHGLSAVARDTAGSAPRFTLAPLPGSTQSVATYRRWFRRFVEVRDEEGAERCLVSALRSGAPPSAVADLLFAAATDHRYLQIGHVLDFSNKAMEALDLVGWRLAETVLPSLLRGLTRASRQEESSAWRHPVDLVAILDEAFEQLPAALAAGESRRGQWRAAPDLTERLLGDDPAAIAAALLAALSEGAAEEQLGGEVAYAASRRMAQFGTANEFGDWDTVLHTFTFANAVQQGLRRAPSAELLRGVFDAAMSVYLDRFLNTPPARLPTAAGGDPAAMLTDLPPLLDRQQQVDAAAQLVASYLGADGDPDRLIAVLGACLLREDRDFHTIQTVEAALRQFAAHRGKPSGTHILIAAARYLAAHAPTVRAQDQTFRIALRLHRGEALWA